MQPSNELQSLLGQAKLLDSTVPKSSRMERYNAWNEVMNKAMEESNERVFEQADKACILIVCEEDLSGEM